MDACAHKILLNQLLFPYQLRLLCDISLAIWYVIVLSPLHTHTQAQAQRTIGCSVLQFRTANLSCTLYHVLCGIAIGKIQVTEAHHNICYSATLIIIGLLYPCKLRLIQSFSPHAHFYHKCQIAQMRSQMVLQQEITGNQYIMTTVITHADGLIST